MGSLSTDPGCEVGGASAFHRRGPGYAAPTEDSAGGVPDELRPGGAFDSYLARLAADDAFSGTVLLTHRGRRVLARSHGWADRERRIATGPDTIFCLDSISTAVTAVAVAQLPARDKIADNAPVGAYLDGFAPSVAEHVTVHHLFTPAGMDSSDFYTRAEWGEGRRFVTSPKLPSSGSNAG